MLLNILLLVTAVPGVILLCMHQPSETTIIIGITLTGIGLLSLFIRFILYIVEKNTIINTDSIPVAKQVDLSQENPYIIRVVIGTPVTNLD
jgi:hypothetical protein